MKTLLIALLLVGGSAECQSRPLSTCELARKAQRFDSKVVTIKGKIAAGWEYVHIYSDECPRIAIALDETPRKAAEFWAAVDGQYQPAGECVLADGKRGWCQYPKHTVTAVLKGRFLAKNRYPMRFDGNLKLEKVVSFEKKENPPPNPPSIVPPR